MKKKKRSKGHGMKKGSAFEREICKKISLWWSEGQREDIYWRTSGSGARATQRSKSKKKTYGQYGDVQAVDPIGEPLTKLCTIEIKRGYSKYTFADLLEKAQNPKVKICLMQQFIEQAEKSCEEAHTYAWLIISKRNGRTPIVSMPYYLYNRLQCGLNCPYGRIKFENSDGDAQSIFITTLDELLDISPDVFKGLYRRKCI